MRFPAHRQNNGKLGVFGKFLTTWRALLADSCVESSLINLPLTFASIKLLHHLSQSESRQ